MSRKATASGVAQKAPATRSHTAGGLQASSMAQARASSNSPSAISYMARHAGMDRSEDRQLRAATASASEPERNASPPLVSFLLRHAAGKAPSTQEHPQIRATASPAAEPDASASPASTTQQRRRESAMAPPEQLGTDEPPAKRARSAPREPDTHLPRIGPSRRTTGSLGLGSFTAAPITEDVEMSPAGLSDSIPVWANVPGRGSSLEVKGKAKALIRVYTRNADDRSKAGGGGGGFRERSGLGLGLNSPSTPSTGKGASDTRGGQVSSA